MGLCFFAANGGKQTNLIITVQDERNQFIEAEIYIDLPEMRKLMEAVKEIETSFKDARKAIKKRDLFK